MGTKTGIEKDFWTYLVVELGGVLGDVVCIVWISNDQFSFAYFHFVAHASLFGQCSHSQRS